MIAGKVWGATEELLATPFVEVHRIVVLPGGRCSRHLHRTRANAFYVVRGEITVHVKKQDYDLTDVTLLAAGQIMVVSPGEVHWFETEARHGASAEVLEIYFPTPLWTGDIEREDHGELRPVYALPLPPSIDDITSGHFHVSGNHGRKQRRKRK